MEGLKVQRNKQRSIKMYQIMYQRNIDLTIIYFLQKWSKPLPSFSTWICKYYSIIHYYCKVNVIIYLCVWNILLYKGHRCSIEEILNNFDSDVEYLCAINLKPGESIKPITFRQKIHHGTIPIWIFKMSTLWNKGALFPRRTDLKGILIESVVNRKKTKQKSNSSSENLEPSIIIKRVFKYLLMILFICWYEHKIFVFFFYIQHTCAITTHFNLLFKNCIFRNNVLRNKFVCV